MRNRTVSISLNGATLALLALLLITFVAFLGMTLFNTKGEPREALVAVSMLAQDNWILPESCGADLPYKPPMLAWCIAAFGWLNGGEVTPFLARLPSALSAIVMILCVFRFVANRQSLAVAMVTALVTATVFEMHRAATSCRVDMMLTAFMVMAILAMYTAWERRRFPWLGVLMMSFAVLSKGPVGMILPCGVMLVLRLMKGERFWPCFGQLVLAGVLSLIIPALWYVAAWHRGGERFLALAMEENLGRFTGKMSYSSHENPVWYNFVTLFAGLAPYTLLLIFSLFAWKHFPKWRSVFSNWWARLRALPPHDLLAVVAAVVIFVFYCIPKSKRSVYLLPMCPFVVYGITIYIRWMCRNASRILRTFGVFMSIVGALAAIGMLLIMCGAFDAPEGSKLADYLHQGRSLGAVALLIVIIALAGTLGSLRVLFKGSAEAVVQWTVVDILLIYWMFSAAIQPMVLNPKSDRPMAAAVEAIVPADEPIYGFMTTPMLRYYTAGFYMHDRIRAVTDRTPLPSGHGWILCGEFDTEALHKALPKGAELIPVMEWPRKSCDNKQPTTLYEYVAPAGRQ